MTQPQQLSRDKQKQINYSQKTKHKQLNILQQRHANFPIPVENFQISKKKSLAFLIEAGVFNRNSIGTRHAIQIRYSPLQHDLTADQISVDKTQNAVIKFYNTSYIAAGLLDDTSEARLHNGFNDDVANDMQDKNARN